MDNIMKWAIEIARSDYENMYLEKVPAEHNNDIDWICWKIKDRKIEFWYDALVREYERQKE